MRKRVRVKRGKMRIDILPIINIIFKSAYIAV